MRPRRQGLRAPDSRRRVATGMSDLDRMMGGLQASDLVIITGRPGMGKRRSSCSSSNREGYYLKNKQPREGTEEHLTWMQEMERATVTPR